MIGLSSAPALARGVVVFPLDGRGVPRETADQVTEVVKSVLRTIRTVEVLDTASVEKRLGVQLTDQARACEYDTFCLVEVGEILKSERMLVGHVRRAGKEQAPDELELKLVVLDVAKASVVDVLLWRLPNRDGAPADAARAATRRLFAAPDAKVIFDLTPPTAEVAFYGDPISRPKGQAFSYWSGAYYAHITADGHAPVDTRISIPEGGPTRIAIELEIDPLWVAKPKDKTKALPFTQGSRREGSGVTAQEAGAETEAEVQLAQRGSPFANPIAWTVTGAGLAAAVVGAVIAHSAQSDYNAYSGQERYVARVTGSSSDASRARDDARSAYTRGAIIATAGAAVAAAGLAWMVIDAITRDSPSARGVRSDRGPKATLEVSW